MSEGSVLVIGHGGSLKSTLCVLLRLLLSSFARLRIDNASMTSGVPKGKSIVDGFQRHLTLARMVKGDGESDGYESAEAIGDG